MTRSARIEAALPARCRRLILDERGEGLTTSSGYDAASFTPERCASAVRAGTAAVLHGRTGIVIQLG